MSRFIDLKKLSTENIERGQEAELIATSRELQSKEIDIPIKKINQNDIYDFFLKLDVYGISEEPEILLTDTLWYYFKNPEEAFLLYNGKKVWDSENGVLI